MGRLDDIIERNKNPKTSFRKPVKGAPAATPAVTDGASSDEPVVEKPAGRRAPIGQRGREALDKRTESVDEQGKNRLDRIIARNERPDAKYRWLKVGLAGIVLFIVLVLLIFTDLAAPPEAAYPETPTAKPTGVDGVKLWKAPKKSGSSAKP